MPLPCIWALGLSACVKPGDFSRDSGDSYTGDTFIEAVSVSCSADSDEWTIEVDTEGWTAGGLMAWTADGQTLEEHDLTSVEADARGAWDVLRLELRVVADPRDQSRNSSTVLLCDPPTHEGLRGWLEVYDPATEAAVDCRAWGEVFDWEGFGYSPCATTIELR